MKHKFNIAFFLFILIFFSFSLCHAQGFPSANETPFSNKAKGFVQATLGLSFMPYIDISSDHIGEGVLSSKVRNPKVNIPGLAAGLAFIPVFSNNGVLLEVAYSLNGVEYDHDVNYNGTTYTSSSTNGLGLMNINIGYVRYFMEGPYHLYLNAIPGFQMVMGRNSSSFPDEDERSSSDKFNNITAALGFGFFKEVMAGGMGLELRTEYSFLQSELTFDDPFGKADYLYTHPIQIKFMAVFLLGGL